MSHDAKRFWRKVNTDGKCVRSMPSNCWEWTGTVDAKGYPRFKLRGVSVLANRARFILDGYTIKPGRVVVSLCQNQLCVRPEHHALGTPNDARKLGRNGIISPILQQWIRESLQNKAFDAEHVTLAFGISPEAVAGIRWAGFV